MGLNVLPNTIFFILLVGFIIGLGIVIMVGDQVDSTMTAAISQITGTGPGKIDVSGETGYMFKWQDWKPFVLSAEFLLLYLLVLLTIFSSFIDETDFSGYVVSAIAGFTVTAVGGYVAAFMWNQITVLNIISFAQLQPALWFIYNLPALFAINLFASMLCFVFSSIKARSMYAPPPV